MKILVAIDSSTCADRVVEEVANRAWPNHADLMVLTCVSPINDADTEEVHARTARGLLIPRVDYLARQLPALSISSDVQIGDAARTIIDVAKEWNADLVVIGSHGDTGFRPTKVGSVAAAVVNRAPCSVDVVKVGRHAKIA